MLPQAKALPPTAPNGIIPGRENEISRRLAVFEEFHMREFQNRSGDILAGIPKYFTTYYPEIFSDFKPFFLNVHMPAVKLFEA